MRKSYAKWQCYAKKFKIFAFENRSYLGELEAEFKKALARESGAQGVLFDEKTKGRKSRDTVPLRDFSMLISL
jgi:hypothetical protein